MNTKRHEWQKRMHRKPPLTDAYFTEMEVGNRSDLTEGNEAHEENGAVKDSTQRRGEDQGAKIL